MRLLLRGDDDTGENTERAGISVDQVISGSTDNSKSTQTEQGWVVIDGRKYRVVGNMLVPG
jgi:hypothetical protein